MELLRCWLFVPAGRPKLLESAARSRADALVLDLEDGVPTSQKAAARRLAAQWLPRLATRRRRVFVRLNGLGSGLTRDDLLAVAGPKLSGVVLPKTEAAQDLRELDVLIREAEVENGVRPGEVATVPLIESARGVLRCEQIASASDRVAALSIGAEDYTRDLGVDRRPDGLALQHIRAVVVQVAAAYALQPVDTPYTDFRDSEGLAQELAIARAVGLKGKFAIHPEQVAPIQEAFTPSPQEVEAARRIVEAYDAAVLDGRAVVALNGAMIDAPVAERARAVLAAARR